MIFTSKVEFTIEPTQPSPARETRYQQVRIIVSSDKRKDAFPKMERHFRRRFIPLRKKQGFNITDIRWGKIVKIKLPFSELINDNPE